MAAYCPECCVRKIAYVIVNFDDSLHEYADYYSDQINRFVAANPVLGIELAFHIKPPFYSATV